MTRAWPWWLGAAAVAGTVAVLSSIPASHLGTHWLWKHDKLIHASVWATLGALLAGGGAARGWSRAVTVAIAIGLAVSYGALDELHQRFTPGRDSSLGDLLADSIGATIGAVACIVARPRWLRSSSPSPAADP